DPRLRPHTARVRAGGALAGQPANVAQHLPAGARALQPLTHGRIVARQSCHEFLDRAALETRGYQALDPDIAELELEPHFAAENDELAGDVHPGEVIARIRLGVPPLARIEHDIGERGAPVIDVEKVSEGPGEDALDTRDLIFGLP